MWGNLFPLVLFRVTYFITIYRLASLIIKFIKLALMKQTFDTCVLGGGIPGIYAMYKLDDADICLTTLQNLGGRKMGLVGIITV